MSRTRSTLIAALACFGLMIGASRASNTVNLPDRIEEDWALVVGTPDTVGNGPQITTTMSPTADHTSSSFVAFDMNYREYPDYTPGGLQIQVWSGQDLKNTSTQGTSQLNTSNETITWTQAMSLSAGTVTYGINNGQSTTWGKFGQGNGLLSVSFASLLTDLSGYSPTVSIANSGATWQSNHVTSLAIVQVRYYSNGQLIQTDNTRRDCPLPP